MIGEITRLGQAAGRRTWLGVVASHMLGSTLSAGVLGFVLGTIGLVVGLIVQLLSKQLVLGLALLACAIRDAGVVSWRLPSLRRQTSACCQRVFGTYWGAFVWGADLGQGWTTLILFTGYYAIVLWAVLNADPIQGALLVGLFGLGRALPVIVVGLSPTGIDCGLGRLQHLPTLQQMNAAALAFTAGYLLVR